MIILYNKDKPVIELIMNTFGTILYTLYSSGNFLKMPIFFEKFRKSRENSKNMEESSAKTVETFLNFDNTFTVTESF